MKILKGFWPTWEEAKVLATMFLIIVIFFGAFAVYRALEVDPVLNEVYSEVHGLNEEGSEW